jgi:general secretion pathway protein H
MTRDDAARGFTLLELVVALAIAAILLGLVMPRSLDRQDRATLRQGARDLARALRQTRNEAIASDRPQIFSLDLVHRLYRGAGQRAAASLPARSEVRLYTATEEMAGAKEGAIRFYPDGSSTGGGVVLVGNGEHIAVMVDWLTGGISVEDGPDAAPR